MPDTNGNLSIEQIKERLNAILDEFGALNLNDASSDEDIAKGEALANEASGLRGQIKAQEQRAETLARITKELTPEPEPVPEPVAEAVEPVAAAPEPEPVAAAPEPEPVAASAKTNPARRAAANAPEQRIPDARPTAVITAAADVPGFPNGEPLDLDRASEAVINRLRGMPSHFMPNTRMRFGAAVIRRGGFGDLVQDRSGDDYSLVNRAGDEKRLKGNSLVAAGGWCAPSETLYDICADETLDGILSLPEMEVSRGGVRFSTGPDFSDIYNAASGFWSLTEAQAIAGTPAKTCYDVTCPTFAEVRLDAVGVCIKVPILTNAGYPELTRRVVAGALVAHQHKVNAKVIGAIAAAAGAAIVVPDQKTFLFNLDHLEWQAEAIRQAYQLANRRTIEAVLPAGAKSLIRAELGRRTGVELQSVSDAQINEWFSVRGLAPQFVRDWQPLAGGHTLQAIPATIEVLLYPSGSWTKGTNNVINLDTVYDAASLQANMYTGLFVEEGVAVIQRCLGTTRLSLGTCVAGRTGMADSKTCMGTAAA